MALFQCPECGHLISDKAIKCPKCGCPTGLGVSPSPNRMIAKGNIVYSSDKTDSRKWLYAVIGVLTAVLVAVTAFLLLRNTNAEESSEFASGAVEGAKTYALSTAELGWLNIRESPSTSSKIVGKMRTCVDEAVVLGKEDDWYRVRFNGVEGYVNEPYIFAGTKEEIEEYRNTLRMPTYKQANALWEWAPTEGPLSESDFIHLADFIPGMKFIKCDIDNQVYGPEDTYNGETAVIPDYWTCYGMNVTDVRNDNGGNIFFSTDQSRACGIVVRYTADPSNTSTSIEVFFKEKTDADTFYKQFKSSEKLVRKEGGVDIYERTLIKENGYSPNIVCRVKEKGGWYVVKIEDYV